jgi:enoyl-CoA hydratase/carnithine racemase
MSGGAQAVVRERRGSALWVRLNRPDALNSIDEQVLAQLHDAITEAEGDDAVRALVLTGNGRAFCAGVDLELVAATRSGGGDAGFLTAVGALMTRLEKLSKPTIAAVNGFALAGGLELVLCCDLVVAAESAKLGDAHANYGLLPGGGGSVRLPRRVGPGLAKQLMFTGDFLAAAELRGSGLVNDVVPDERLVPAVDLLVDRIAAKSPLGLRRMKQLVDDALEQSVEAGLRAELLASELHSQSADMGEGLSAFRDKRSPQFTGR